jgi:hypothetical protein
LPRRCRFESVNLNELAAALPREAERLDMRYQWISRVLGNELIDISQVMAPFAAEVLERSAEGGRTIVAMIDQSKVNDAHQMLMVSLAAVAALLPEDARVTLMGDRRP